MAKKVPVLEVIGQFFAPLIVAVRSPHYLKEFIKDLDIHIELNQEQTELIQTILGVVESLKDLEDLIKKAKEKSLDAGTITEQVIHIAQSLYEAIEELQEISPSEIAQLPEPLGDKNWWKEKALEIPGYLLLRWLQVHVSYVYEMLYFVDIITETKSEKSDAIIKKIHWDRFPDLFTQPGELVIEQFDWSDDFNHQYFLYKFKRFIKTFGLPTQKTLLRENIINEFYTDTFYDDSFKEVSLSLLPEKTKAQLPGFVDPKLYVTPVPSETNGSGLFLNASLLGNLPTEHAITDEWSVDFSSITEALQQSVGIEIHTNELKLKATLPEPYAKLVFKGQPNEPWILFGNPEGARLELSGLEAFFEIEESGGKAAVGFGVKTLSASGMQALKLVINPADGDNFISKVLGDKELAITADLGLSWHSERGLEFEGGVGFEVVVPLNLQLGPIKLDHLRIGAGAGTDGVQLELAVTGGLDIGVISAVIEDIGLRAFLVPVEKGEKSGLLGGMDLVLAFKPPSGMGLSLSAGGIVSGGGYLAHDESKYQYAGIAEIQFVKFGLAAIGILNTKMPDGSKGWSLFLSVFSEFPPLPLGFGFTLNGVGGLVGLHRTLNVEALRERLLTGALDSIMFPDDPVKNAVKIIDDITSIFPPQQGQFIFGAMMQIGWGAPKSLVTVNLGVMVELPNPVRIALLGQLEAYVPDEKVPVIELHMDVFGLVDFGAKSFSLDAVLRDSSIVKLLTLSGDMAMRANFSGQPSFMLSVGGYHPAYVIPPEFPELRRMKAALPLGKLAAIEVTCYMAITSNTFQMGGRLDIWAKIASFSIEGYLYMDALIQFSPFGFIVNIGFGISVKVGKVSLLGIEVNGTLAGPNPFTIIGEATFTILGFEASVKLDITVGKDKSIPPEKVNVEEKLIEALSEESIWQVIESGESVGGIHLREPQEDEVLRVNPSGSIQLLQNVVPFNCTIETFGAGEVEGLKTFEVDRLGYGAFSFEKDEIDYIEDYFAPAHFFKMSDKEKLKAPSFEKMEGGMVFSTDDVEAGGDLDYNPDYEVIINDPAFSKRVVESGSTLEEENYKGLADKEVKVTGLNQLFHKGTVSQQAAQLSLSEPSYTVVHPETLEPQHHLVSEKGVSFSQALRVAKVSQVKLSDSSKVTPLVIRT